MKAILGLAALALIANIGAAEAKLTKEQMAEMGLALENDVIFGGKVERIPDLVGPNFVEHNINDHAAGIKEYTEIMTKRAEMLAKNPQMKRTFKLSDGVTIYGEDSVNFVRPGMEVDDPRNPGQKIKRTHFDLFRFENDKIVEHWD